MSNSAQRLRLGIGASMRLSRESEARREAPPGAGGWPSTGRPRGTGRAGRGYGEGYCGSRV